MSYSQEKLKKCFDYICNAEDWRNPVNKKIKKEKFSTDLINSAVIHFTATAPRIEQAGPNMIKVTAPGYFNGPCYGCF